jgi:hypothetical protein
MPAYPLHLRHDIAIVCRNVSCQMGFVSVWRQKRRRALHFLLMVNGQDCCSVPARRAIGKDRRTVRDALARFVPPQDRVLSRGRDGQSACHAAGRCDGVDRAAQSGQARYRSPGVVLLHDGRLLETGPYREPVSLTQHTSDCARLLLTPPCRLGDGDAP